LLVSEVGDVKGYVRIAQSDFKRRTKLIFRHHHHQCANQASRADLCQTKLWRKFQLVILLLGLLNIIESVAFFYIPDPLREPLCVKKKITWFKKRRHVYPLFFSGCVSDAPRRVRKTFLLIYTRNYKWPRNITLSILIYTLFFLFSKILLIRKIRLFRPIYYIMVKIVLTRIKRKLYNYLILIFFLKGLQPLVINIQSLSLYIYNPKYI
jgi:hypothetical protein